MGASGIYRMTLYFALGGMKQMHKTYIAVALGATLALVLNKTIAGFLNTVLSPLGLTYA